MKYITEQGLKELSDYKYKPGGYTKLDGIMNHFWEWTIKQVPHWVAPNLLTFIGWLFVIASYANMLRYDYTFRQDIPSSAFFFAAICIFIYSTLDAIDGKQARRTKSSSPLGQLFDHGCDSFSLTFFMLAICQATKLEPSETFLMFIACQMSFWISNWTEYNTGVLTTKVGQFGVTQAEFTCMLMHIATGIFGQDMWHLKLNEIIPALSSIAPQNQLIQQLINLKLGTSFAYFYGGLLISMSIYMTLKTIYKSHDRSSSVSEFLSFVLLVAMELSWSKMKIYNQYNGIILVNFGVIASLLVCKMIICSVTRMKFQYFHSQIIPLVVSTILMVVLDLYRAPFMAIKIVFWLCFATNFAIIMNFLYHTVNQITDFLGIYCFSLNKKRTVKSH